MLRRLAFLRSPIGWASSFHLATIMSPITAVDAQDTDSVVPCRTEFNTFIWDWNGTFSVYPWMENGMCIRAGGNVDQCYANLAGLLKNLDYLRAAEYNGSAGVLALLPTLGAMLGAPTNEIWELRMVVPFAGFLAMIHSFGSAILPRRVEDYESGAAERLHPSSSFSIRNIPRTVQNSEHEAVEMLTSDLLIKLRGVFRRKESIRVARRDVWLGLVGMLILFGGSQATMSIIERGGIVTWFCDSYAWMHLWYVLVTTATILESRAQFPFSKQTRLFLSDVPYNVSVSGGDDITGYLREAGTLDDLEISIDKSIGKAIGTALGQLETLRPGTVQINGSLEFTKPRNGKLVTISVINEGKNKLRDSFGKLASKILSIGVFVTGTAFFSSVQLLHIEMAVLALTPILAAAIFGRVLVSYITTSVSRSEPMFHVIVKSESEMNQIVAKIMMLTRHADNDSAEQNRAIQIELNGHVFVNCQRVFKRSKFYVKLLGIMARPFDLGKLVRKTASDSSPVELQPLAAQSLARGVEDDMSRSERNTLPF